MRLKLPLLVFSAALLASCAFEGTVVQKDAQPHPFYLSQGIDGKYAFILQDKAGVRHRQLVTPEVYERYAVGDYFNDMQTAPGTAHDPKSVQQTAPVMTASVKPRPATQHMTVANRNAKAARVASAGKSSKKPKQMATKAAGRKRAVAQSKIVKPAPKPITIAAITPAPEPAVTLPQSENDFGIFTIARCR
jgi:hypothetical protein